MTDPTLHDLADRFGVATSWSGHGGRTTQVGDDTLRTVLRALGAPLDAGDVDTREVDTGDAPDRRPGAAGGDPTASAPPLLPPATVVRHGTDHAEVRVGPGDRVSLVREDGTREELPVIADGGAVRLPVALPLGYHRLEVVAAGDDGDRKDDGDQKDDADRGDDGSPQGGDPVVAGELIVVPDAAPCPDRGWGFMLQLYALRSTDSWGFGDLADLRTLARWAAEEGADFIVCNPLHAAAPTLPQEPSPYFPSSRRYWNPTYLRIENIPEHATADDTVRAEIAALAADRRADNTADTIDRDATWEAKRTALELLWQTPHTPARRDALTAFRDREGEPLTQFALWNALAEVHGPDWRTWPEELRAPDGAGVAATLDEHADRVAFHAWLQFLVNEQLAATQVTAREAGMRVGIVHDLAVGVNPAGADGWALQDHLALGVTVGAPPDDFNQLGQDWAQPPLLPTTLTATGYTVIRDLVRRLLRNSGGIRIDHILGYFRLFWIPEGADGAVDGTYVRYPSEDLLGILALEAERAGAIVIGEDLGVVAPGVREAMRDRQLLGSRLLYFTYDDHGNRMPAPGYETSALASVTTHDLPTAAGWWSDEGVRVQVDLGLLGEDTTAEQEYERKAQEHLSMEELLSADGLLPPDSVACTDADRVTAMHAFLSRCGSVLVAGNLPDAVGDLRQPNMPGTTDAYPNWRLPVATPDDGVDPESAGHTPILLEDLMAHPQVRRTIDALASARPRS